MELTWSAVDPIGFEEVELDRSRVAIAQLVARRSRNPKVVNSILTCHTLVATHTHCFELARNPAQRAAIPPERNSSIEHVFLNIPRIFVEEEAIVP